jgi:hypothetical protein
MADQEPKPKFYDVELGEWAAAHQETVRDSRLGDVPLDVEKREAGVAD